MHKRLGWGVVVLAACALVAGLVLRLSSPNAAMLGDWVEPVPGMVDQVQGFSLRASGVAESIDMATLQYREWRVDRGALVLAGESIGNGTTSRFEDTFRIVSFDGQRLELEDARGMTRVYMRR